MANSGISDCIENCLIDYFDNLKGTKTKNLYAQLLKEFDAPLIEMALKQTKGNKVKTADILGINRNTLSKKMKELKIHSKNFK